MIAITLDLEMSRNFPAWEDTHWDYHKGNLDKETKDYTVEACRRVKAAGGVLHAFVVGRVLEQENVDWLREIAAGGHPIGNHTYDHVNVKAKAPEALQYRFQRAPWLIRGKKVDEVVRDNIAMTSVALAERVGVEARGFRTPGGFHPGLTDRADVQRLLQDLGFSWVSSMYPAHPYGEPGGAVPADVFDAIEAVQAKAQPFVYPGGLVEIPMSPISDITAFRSGRWKLESFLTAIGRAVEWAIAQRQVFDFLGHPSCLHVVDPGFRTVDLICDLVARAGDRARLVGLDTIAAAARQRASE